MLCTVLNGVCRLSYIIAAENPTRPRSLDPRNTRSRRHSRISEPVEIPQTHKDNGTVLKATLGKLNLRDGWSAYGLFRAHRYHRELKRTELAGTTATDVLKFSLSLGIMKKSAFWAAEWQRVVSPALFLCIRNNVAVALRLTDTVYVFRWQRWSHTYDSVKNI